MTKNFQTNDSCIMKYLVDYLALKYKINWFVVICKKKKNWNNKHDSVIEAQF